MVFPAAINQFINSINNNKYNVVTQYPKATALGAAAFIMFQILAKTEVLTYTSEVAKTKKEKVYVNADPNSPLYLTIIPHKTIKDFKFNAQTMLELDYVPETITAYAHAKEKNVITLDPNKGDEAERISFQCLKVVDSKGIEIQYREVKQHDAFVVKMQVATPNPDNKVVKLAEGLDFNRAVVKQQLPTFGVRTPAFLGKAFEYFTGQSELKYSKVAAQLLTCVPAIILANIAGKMGYNYFTKA
jgi:hypothetical protein